MSVNEVQLLTFLDERRSRGVPLVAAIYDGLASRVRRGDFEAEGDEQ